MHLLMNLKNTCIGLALHHRDPFDRMIISQALSEQLTVIGKDDNFDKYQGLKLLW